jgi:3-hydroxyisobutyrate dehydrogenase-like beta-hydroxyacid dehydrogenase
MNIGLIGLGDMGAAVGHSLTDAGHKVSAVLQGRSDDSRRRAGTAGIIEVSAVAALLEMDVILSIVPPGVAKTVATETAAAARETNQKPLYADLNAISPQSAREIASKFTATQCTFVDGSIIGAAPAKGPRQTRIYLSGSQAGSLLTLTNDQIRMVPCGSEIGQASGLKMVYAALTKGTMTLHTAVLLTAHQLGLSEPLLAELESTRSEKLQEMRNIIPFIAADSVRWADEMDEIAKTFADVGVSGKFHEGAAEIFRLLAQTPLEKETRETLDLSRSLEDTISTFAKAIKAYSISAVSVGFGRNQLKEKEPWDG